MFTGPRVIPLRPEKQGNAPITAAIMWQPQAGSAAGVKVRGDAASRAEMTLGVSHRVRAF